MAFAVTAAVKRNHKLRWYNKAALLYHPFLLLYHYSGTINQSNLRIFLGLYYKTLYVMEQLEDSGWQNDEKIIVVLDSAFPVLHNMFSSFCRPESSTHTVA